MLLQPISQPVSLITEMTTKISKSDIIAQVPKNADVLRNMDTTELLISVKASYDFR